MDNKKRHVLVDRHFEKTINLGLMGGGNKRKVRITLAGIPAIAECNEHGQPLIASAKIESEEQLLDSFVNPIALAIGKAKEIEKLPLPHVTLQFSQPQKADKSSASEPPANSDKLADFPVETPRWGLDRVIIPPSTRNQLEIVLGLIKHHNLMYNEWDLKSVEGSQSYSVSLNFYGYSGTGKTLCAEAIAHHLGRKILCVRYSELESELVGMTNKNISKVFSRATEENSVLFFDEADSILGKRLSVVKQSADHGVNIARSTMLIELERFKGVVIFATNFITNYDFAFARRILHSVQFDLPDETCREQIFQCHLPSKMPLENDVTIDALAKATEKFSGGEIWKVVKKSAARAANQDIPDEQKKVSLQHFLSSISDVEQERKAILGESL
jgi:SpoVK/Ycf46/Vps4 family AAA+-type ATPase